MDCNTALAGSDQDRIDYVDSCLRVNKSEPDSKRVIVIFDIDGTIADDSHRHHFLNTDADRTKEDWDNYWAGANLDAPIYGVISVLMALHAAGYEIILMTGRSDCTLEATKTWLEYYKVPYHRLYMRPTGDFSNDDKVKYLWLKTDFRFRPVLGAFEDRDRVVKMWREEAKIQCFQVREGNF